MKKTFNWLLFLLVVLAISALLNGLFVLMQRDEKLTPDVITLLDSATAAKTSQAYLYLLGILAHEGEDPLETGKRIFASIQQGEQNMPDALSEFHYQAYPLERQLPQPTGKLFCRTGQDEGCLDELFSSDNQASIKDVLKNNTILLERYRTFIQMDDFHTLSKPQTHEVFPPYAYLTQGNRLLALQAIQLTQQNEADTAVALLLENNNHLRAQFSHADNLVGKMVLNSAIASNLDILSSILTRYAPEKRVHIPEISASERNLYVAIAREFTSYRNICQTLGKIWEKNPYTQNWMARFFFKPNATINASYPRYAKIADVSQKCPQDFQQTVTTHQRQSAQVSPQNYVGTILNRVNAPEGFYDDYVGRLFDLDGKIILFNLAHDRHLSTQQILEQSVAYYTPDQHPELSNDKRHMCFGGPLPDKWHLRCLALN